MSTQALVPALPPCDFADVSACEGDDRYDFKTDVGPWANGCPRHWEMFRAHPDLGTGKGQRLVVGVDSLTQLQRELMDSIAATGSVLADDLYEGAVLRGGSVVSRVERDGDLVLYDVRLKGGGLDRRVARRTESIDTKETKT